MRLGVVRGVSYGLFGPPDEFAPQVEELGAGVVRAYVFWSQVEPEPGQYAWGVVDKLLGQIPDGVQLWLTVISSSPWATRVPTTFLPASPAKDLKDYERFVRKLAERCAGRVAYWQPDNEVSNHGLQWAGTASEYLDQLRVFHEAVDGPVVLAGCGYDVFSSPQGSAQRRFFHDLAKDGRDHYDLFSVNLYGDPAKVADYVDTARDFMKRHGYDKPIVAGEHGGPVLFEFPELERVLHETMMAAMTGRPDAEKEAMAELYRKREELPERLRMFMDGCGEALEAKRDRINARQLVMRSVEAMAQGIEVTNYWSLAPELAGYHEPLQIMHLLFGKLPLYDDRRTKPAADTFRRLAEFLSDVDHIGGVPPYDSVRLFICRGRTPKMIAWHERDTFDGEDLPPVRAILPWSYPTATVTDAFGTTTRPPVEDGRLELEITDTPLFVAV